MQPDRLRKMIAAGPVKLKLNSGETHVLQSPETTIVSDFEIATLMQGKRGLYAGYIAIDAISTAIPVAEGV
ncbi:MAG: hypothetical protein AAF790_14125 [Planctomycetota bacterium]